MPSILFFHPILIKNRLGNKVFNLKFKKVVDFWTSLYRKVLPIRPELDPK